MRFKAVLKFDTCAVWHITPAQTAWAVGINTKESSRHTYHLQLHPWHVIS